MVTIILHKTFLTRSSRQQGVVLLVALIVLVAMTLAALSLVRSIDTGNQVAGNLAFKQGATTAADSGTAAAVSWLASHAGTAVLHQNMSAQGYYATSQNMLDITGTSGNDNYAAVDWDNNNCSGKTPSNCIKPSASMDAGNGNSVSYIIHRLCLYEGDPNSVASKDTPSNSCANYQSRSSTSPKRGELKYGDDKRFEPLPAEYYRITSRVKGPKNTVSFVETIIHF